MALLRVEDALRRALDGIDILPAEEVPLAEAAERILAWDLKARRTQPPFDASAMDGYAVRAADIESPPATLAVIGESAAGLRFSGRVGPGEAVRIFTGAPVPVGADTILLQENASALEADRISALEPALPGRHIRIAGLDFKESDVLLGKGRLLDPAAIALAAAGGHAQLPVVRRPLVALIATGDELVPPDTVPGADQIIASNHFGIGALAKLDGADVLDLGIVPDQQHAIAGAARSALEAGAHIVVTLGGASVGERDLVRQVLTDEGMELDFWKIAMRPGKPLMFGRFGETRVLGLPGNPVSSFICAHLFLRPMIARLSGRIFRADLRPAKLGKALKANDERQDYLRALVEEHTDGSVATPFETQDSSMLTTLARSNGLIIREPHAPAAEAGTLCTVLMLR